MTGSLILRSPLVHFIALGAISFAVREGVEILARDVHSSAPRVSLDADRAEELLYREALARGLDRDDVGIETRIIEQMLFLDESATGEDPARLLDRARGLGLDRDDVVIRRLLAQKMTLFATMLETAELPTQSDLATAFDTRRDSFREPERRSLVHVFLSRDRRGERTFADAEHLRRRIEEEQIEPERAIDLGDPFPLGYDLENRSRDELARSFGDAFAASSFALEPGLWSRPVESAYGFHLVEIERIEAGKLPDFEAVRTRLRLELEAQARDRKLEALLAELRTRYEVAVAEPGEERE